MSGNILENPQVSLDVWYNQNANRIESKIDVCGDITRRVLDLEDDAIRQALIAAGWTPPEGER